MQRTETTYPIPGIHPIHAPGHAPSHGDLASRSRFAVWQDAVREPALSVLLGMQVLFIFFMGPLVSTGTLPRWLLEVSQMLLPLISYFVLPRHSRVRLLILLSIVPILILSLVETGMLVGLLLRMSVTLAITLLVAQAVFRARQVTVHQLLGAIVVYLNLALLFMGVYAVIRYVMPEAFSMSAHELPGPGALLYFSLTTITSTGYGDVLPLHPLARSMANLEAVSGQLFLGTFLARVVTLHGKVRRASGSAW